MSHYLGLCWLSFVFLTGCAASPLIKSSAHAPGQLTSVLYVSGVWDEGVEADRWGDLNALFLNNGYFLRAVHTTGDETIDEGASTVCCAAKEIYPKGRFHIVAKSLGGLWTRRALQKCPDLKSRVASVTTIASPHHGSEAADWLKRNLEWIYTLWTAAPQIEQLSTHYVENTFNKQTPFDPKVKFYSLGLRIEFPAIIRANLVSGLFYGAFEGENDGLVSSKSAHWGQYLETLKGEHIAASHDYWYFGRYNFKYIWPMVFQRVLDNLKKVDAEPQQTGL